MMKLKKLLRWCLWAFVIFVIAIAGLIIADSLHTKSCPDPDMKGKIVEIPGERIEFLNSVNQTDSQILYSDCVRDPHKNPDYRPTSEDGHIHPQQEERFEVIEGRAQFLIGDLQVVLAPGQVGVVPPNTIHNWIALDGKPVRVKAHFSPALDTGPWFLSFHGQLAKGDMNLLQAAVICSEFKKGTPLPVNPHPILWKILVKILAPIGRLIGYKAC
jgi:mannose-6-phosphate isomerase-like protein (cupin superfamily)